MRSHLCKTKTVLRNIHPQFKLIIGSIYMNLRPCENVIVYNYKSPCFQFDGLRPSDDFQDGRISIANRTKVESDKMSNFKVYNDLNQNLVLPYHETDGIIQIQRNFFIYVEIINQKIICKSYNVDKKVFKTCKQIITNDLIWQSNRQDFFKRIVSQKLGTVYTLKDFYASDHLIKDQTLQNLYQSKKFQFEKQAQIIEGKQVYQFHKPSRRSQRSKRK